jgi:hypothetical protein
MMAAPVMLTGRLPGHTQPGGDLWPPDAQVDGVVDEHREFRLCRLPREPGAPDPLQHLGWRQLGNPLRRYWRFHSCLVPSLWLHMPDPRPALRSTHAIEHAGQV